MNSHCSIQNFLTFLSPRPHLGLTFDLIFDLDFHHSQPPAFSLLLLDITMRIVFSQHGLLLALLFSFSVSFLHRKIREIFLLLYTSNFFVFSLKRYLCGRSSSSSLLFIPVSIFRLSFRLLISSGLYCCHLRHLVTSTLFPMARLVVHPTGVLSTATASPSDNTMPPQSNTVMATASATPARSVDPTESNQAESMAVDSDADLLAEQFASLNVFVQPLRSVPAPLAPSAPESEADRYMALARARPNSLVTLTSLAKPASSLALSLASMSLSGPSLSAASKNNGTGNPFLRVGNSDDRDENMTDSKGKGKEADTTGEKKIAPRRKKPPVSCFIEPKRQTPKPPPPPPPASAPPSTQLYSANASSSSASAPASTTNNEERASDGENKTNAAAEQSNSKEIEAASNGSLEKEMTGSETMQVPVVKVVDMSPAKPADKPADKLVAKPTTAVEDSVKPPVRRAAVIFPPGGLQISMAVSPVAAPTPPAFAAPVARLVDSTAS